MIPIVSIFLALGLPAYALRRSGKSNPLRHPYLFSAGSFFFCGIAMIEELLAVRRRVLAGDVGGVEDTIDAVVLLCCVLLGLTLLVNLLLLGLTYEERLGANQE